MWLDNQEDCEMTRLARLMTMAVFAFGAPAAALAQPATPPHQHGQPVAAGQPAAAHQQHQARAGSQHRRQGVHRGGRQCTCPQMMQQMQEMHQMMRQMMQQHAGQGGNMSMMQGHGTQQPEATQGAEDHQHQGQRPH
jgi:hypothetical protein